MAAKAPTRKVKVHDPVLPLSLPPKLAGYPGNVMKGWAAMLMVALAAKAENLFVDYEFRNEAADGNSDSNVVLEVFTTHGPDTVSLNSDEWEFNAAFAALDHLAEERERERREKELVNQLWVRMTPEERAAMQKHSDMWAEKQRS